MFETKNHITTSATITAKACEPQKPRWTADRIPVVELLSLSGIVTMFPNVAQRYAAITASEPQIRYFLIARMSLISTPKFSGTSIPSSARITSPKNVQFEWSGSQLCTPLNEFAECPPPLSQSTPARPITKIAAP